MEKQKKVIDASVIVKWFLNEENSEKALKIREDHILEKTILIIPELTFIEILNALRYKGTNVQRLLDVNKSLWEMQFKVEKINSFILDKAIENSIKYNITIYDSLYVTIAQIHGTSLITADKELLKIPNSISLDKI